MNIWTQLRYFKKGEAWGDPDRMNGGLLLSFDLIRHYFDRSFIVHCGFAYRGHSANSQHYVGNAIDFHVWNMDFADASEKLVMVCDYLHLTNFIGLGYYPEWNNPGFHIDLKGSKARWMWVGGKQVAVTE